MGGWFLSFCGKCGEELEPQAKFCGKCGQVVVDDGDEENTSFDQVRENEYTDSLGNQVQVYQPEAVSKKVLSVKSKIAISIVFFIVVVLSVLWYVGNTIMKPSKMVESFNTAVVSNDKKKVSELIYCNDSRLKISEKSVEPLMQYLKDNPSYSKDMLEQLRKDAITLDADRGLVDAISKKSSSPFTIVESGRKYLIFSNYKIALRPVYLEIDTGVKDVAFSLNNVPLGKSDVDGFSKEYGPFVPGKYEIASSYSGKYTSVTDKKVVDGVSAGDEKIKVNVLDSLKYVRIDSNYPDVEIYVDGKDTGVKVSDAQKFGPVCKGAIVYGIVSRDGKKLKNQEYWVSEQDSIFLDFSHAEDEVNTIQNELYTLLDNCFRDFCKAINNNDFSYVEPYIYPGSSLYNEQKTYVSNTYNSGIREYILSFKITSYTISDDNKSGCINTKEIFDIQNNGKSSIKTFVVKHYFKYNESKKCYQLCDTITSK